MTNEQMAVDIRNGITELIPSLWERVSSFVFMYCKKYYMARMDICRAAGVQLEDLQQEGYFAMLEAVKAYNEGTGYKFITYMSYPLRNTLNTLIGVRTNKDMALNHSASLDMPLSSEDDLTLMDTIEDASDEMAVVENRLYNKQLRCDLDECLNTFPEDEQRVIRLRYYCNMSLKDVSDCIGCTYNKTRSLQNGGLKKFRYSKQAKKLKQYRDDIISRHAYRSSFSLWRDTGYSSTEYTAFKLMGAE